MGDAPFQRSSVCSENAKFRMIHLEMKVKDIGNLVEILILICPNPHVCLNCTVPGQTKFLCVRVTSFRRFEEIAKRVNFPKFDLENED